VKIEIELLARDGNKDPGYTLYLCKAYKKYLKTIDEFINTPSAANFLALENNMKELNERRDVCMDDPLDDDSEYE